MVVPDLEDKTVLEAEKMLSELSLKIKVDDEVYDDEVEKDRISSVNCLLQNPK